MYSSTLPSTSALHGGWVVSTTPRPLYRQERPGTHCIGDWDGHQGRSGRARKISPPPGFDPRILQRVASPYTYSAIPAPSLSQVIKVKERVKDNASVIVII